MSAESVGSCAGGCWNAPPNHSLPNPTSLFREERKLSPNTPDKPYNKSTICYDCKQEGHWAGECPSKTSPFREERKLSPNTPDKPYNKSTICYNCKQEGHWARECPSEGKERSPGPSLRKALFPKCPPNHPELLCKTCYQPCVVRTSRTAANPDRDFYTCPRGQACKMFQWCDEVGKIQSQHVNSPVKPINQHGAAASQNPICTCTAGPCRIETKQHGEWKGRKYFACHLKSGQGHCTHFEWCDGLGDVGEITKNLNCSHPVLFEEQNNTGTNNQGEILEKELTAAFPPPVPTTPRAGHVPDHVDSASSPMKGPNLLKGSPSKGRFAEEEVSKRIGSPSLNCYLNEGPETFEPNREAVGRTLVVSPPLQQHSQMKRLSLAEGSSTTPRAGHMPDHVDSASSPMKGPNLLKGSPSKRRFTEEVVSKRIGSPSLNCYLNEGPETLEPNREAVGRTLVVSPPLQQHSQTKRPSLAEGSSTKREDCLVCGGAGHGVDDCDVLAQLAAEW